MLNIKHQFGKHTDAIMVFEKNFQKKIDSAKGSSGNHQHWIGGYKDHIGQCLTLANALYAQLKSMFDMPFELESALLVLYFHDIEKIWKYSDDGKLPEWFDKDSFPTKQYGIQWTEAELNAFRYVHGEGDDYRKNCRVMNELAGFCHAIDVLSARTFWNVS